MPPSGLQRVKIVCAAAIVQLLSAWDVQVLCEALSGHGHVWRARV